MKYLLISLKNKVCHIKQSVVQNMCDHLQDLGNITITLQNIILTINYGVFGITVLYNK